MTPLLDRETLRRNALSRAARQGAPIARKRLRQRQLAFWAGRALRWGTLPAGAAGAAAWWWLQHGRPGL